MPVLVTNCFHWIGFHIVNKLLEDRYKVHGIHNDTSSNEGKHLSMFFGRNRSFLWITQAE